MWAAADEANRTWASVPELLDRSGARIAELVSAEAARVVPGASAGIALSVAACIARGDGAVGEALPATDAVVLLQAAHAPLYKYSRIAGLSGARVVVVESLRDGLALAPVAILHPAHLDALGEPLAEVRGHGVPVVVDAAYLSYPLDQLARWQSDFTCVSAKYFLGPNGGGFVSGSRSGIADLAALDFTGYESGAWRTFGRAFKLDRATIVATTCALEEWLSLDHAARWAGYDALARTLRDALGGGELAQFTLDERLVDGPVNAVVLRGRAGFEGALAAGDPSVRAVTVGDDLVLCVETLAADEVPVIAGMWRTVIESAR